MIVANFSPDDVGWRHIGESGIIPADDPEGKTNVIEFDDARARHILNKLGRRGLVAMKYNDDESAKRVESMGAWTEFWELQVGNFNRDNEKRKNEKLAYVAPSKEISAHARALNIEVLQPWRIERNDNPEIERLTKRNVQLEGKLDKLTEQLNALIGMVAKDKKIDPPVDKVKQIRKTYTIINKTTMRAFVAKRMEEIPTWPEENQEELRIKWERFYEEDYPLKKNINGDSQKEEI